VAFQGVEGCWIIALSYSQIPSDCARLMEGVLDRHLAHRDLTFGEVPRVIPGVSPFVEGVAGVDGLIVWAEARDRWARDVVELGIPAVNCGMEWLEVDRVASVHVDFPTVRATVPVHFKALGLRRVVAIGHRFADRPMTHRLLVGAGERELEEFLRKIPKPFGVYAFGDHTGSMVCEVAARMGLKVPRQVAVVGHGDNRVARFSNPPRTSVWGNSRQVGQLAADCKAQWLENGAAPFREMNVGGAQLIERESTVGKSGSVLMESIERFIHDHVRRGVTLGELVAMSGLPVKTLVGQYREAFGLDPMEAIELLKTTTRSIGEVATKCGFSSQAAFTNYYQRHFMGLNDVCDWLRLKTKALARMGVTPPPKNGLSHANKERSADFAEKLFWSVLGHLQNASPSFAAGRKGKSDRMRELQPGNSGFADLIIALHELSRNPNHVDAGKTSKACSATARCPMQRTSKHPP
jgi:AraC-like DNA-binding protein